MCLNNLTVHEKSTSKETKGNESEPYNWTNLHEHPRPDTPKKIIGDPKMQTLRRILTESDLDSDLIFLLEDVASSCARIANHVRDMAFEGNLGQTDETNVQGEAQKPLDIIANDIFLETCGGEHVAALVSEEMDEVLWLKDPKAGDYILYFDPLDGSSNLDVNMTVGTIFSVVRVSTDGDRTVLRKGRDQVAAGYAIYGPSTMLVLTTGNGVQGFSARHGANDFRLTHPNMTVSAKGSEIAINMSRGRWWDTPVRRYVEECMAGVDGPRGRDFNMRWIASLVAEVHRILTRGGVFLYPVDSKLRDKGGRLRLMYEASPMAMIMEQAGASAVDGITPILDLVPDDPHQRAPLILGSKDEVERLVAYHREG